jgi:hypothetical protein
MRLLDCSCASASRIITKGAIVSSTEGLYGAVQRGIIKEMLRL